MFLQYNVMMWCLHQRHETFNMRYFFGFAWPFRYVVMSKGWTKPYGWESQLTTLEAKLYDCPDTITNTSDYFLALWMGSDEFTTAKICGEKVYKQLAELKEIIHPKTGQTLSVLRRTTADGKARRTSTGNSTACSSYPIPEAPEHIDQLGDMKVLFEKPLHFLPGMGWS